MWRGRKRSDELAPGRSLGPYRLAKQLGEGGMGVVFLAERDDGRRVALKLLKPELSGDEVYRRRFLHEARAASEVSHKYLVPVLDAGDIDGFHYIAVEYVAGISLEGRIREQGPVPLPDVPRVAAQVGAALDALHERGLVHRDVKPSNIMLDEHGDAALTDFGLARGRGYTVLTKPGQVMGTLDYIAPELVRGLGASPASDLYALGCTIYEAITGAPPFASKSTLEAALAHLEEEPPDPRGARPEVPESLAWAVLQALVKDPERRPSTGAGYAQMIRVAMLPVGR
jgi:serine/threonine protein kinase